MTIVMEFSEEQIRDILELKERLTAQIEKHKESSKPKTINLLVIILRITKFLVLPSLMMGI